MPSTPATKADLAAFGDGLRETIRENTREIIQHFNKSQSAQNEQLDAMAEDISKIKVAVVDLLATDRHLHNLVRELKAQNIPIDEGKIFAE